MNLEEKSYIE